MTAATRLRAEPIGTPAISSPGAGLSLLSAEDQRTLDEIRAKYPPRSDACSSPSSVMTRRAAHRATRAVYSSKPVVHTPWWKFRYYWTWPTRLLTVAGVAIAIQLGLIVSEVRSH